MDTKVETNFTDDGRNRFPKKRFGILVLGGCVVFGSNGCGS
jgi:hypothetical protein